MESSVTLTKAVLFSLLIHAFVLYMLYLFAFKPQIIEGFPNIAVYLITAVTSDQNPGARVEAPDSFIPQEELVVNKKSVKSIEPDLSQADEAFSPQTQGSESSVIKEPGISSDAVSESAIEDESTGAAGVSHNIQSGSSLDEGESFDSKSLEDNSLNVDWEGASAQVRFIPDPSFNLPHDGILPDEVLVSFSVLADGSVSSVKVLPPATGSLNLDLQIRSYVRSFLFEIISQDETPIKGLLHLNLTERKLEDP